MKRLSTYFFLIIIFGMGIGSSMSYLFRVDSYKLNNTVIKDTIWTVNDGSSIKINEEQSSIMKSYIQYMEEAIDANLFLKQSFIEYYGIIQRLLHRNIVEDASKENDVYKLTNGSLALGGKVKNVGIGNQEGDLYNKRIISLKVLDSVVYETTGNHLYYISTPIKINDLNVPYHLLHTNLFKKYLNEIKYNTSIHFYDLDNDYITSGTRMFYFTDHHWRVEYVFSRMKDICHFLSVDSSCFESHNWQLINTEKIFRGSLANRVGDYFIVEKDTFKYYTPIFHTKIRASYYSYPHLVKIREGELDKTVMFPEMLESDDKYTNLYAFCNHGDNPFVQIYNYRPFVNEHILILGDSFSSPIVMYLSPVFKDITVIDLRSYKEKNLRKMIMNNKYDKVILIYNKAIEVMFNFK